jgi:flagellum-specific peptidoglycan hydrolase FlgJ
MYLERLLLAPTREQVVEYVLSRPHGEYSDNDVRTIIQYYDEAATDTRLDVIIAIAQMALETGNLSSWWAARPRCNPAGIGVTGEVGKGISFGSWAQSVPAHVGRLLAYALRSSAQMSAKEYELIEIALRWRPLPEAMRGSGPTIALMARSWAADPEYASSLSRVYDDITR